MKKIRQGVFETNSSSTHSICIVKNPERVLPKSLHFKFGEFGWEYNRLYSAEEKADYLYTALIAKHRNDIFSNIIKILENEGVKVTFEKPLYETLIYTSGGERKEFTVGTNIGYIDHVNELDNFIADIDKKEILLNYLFSDLSFIITGNDNDCHDVSIKINYPHYEYYKGN